MAKRRPMTFKQYVDASDMSLFKIATEFGIASTTAERWYYGGTPKQIRTANAIVQGSSDNPTSDGGVVTFETLAGRVK